MTNEEAIKIVKIMSDMELHCCRGCAEALVSYFIKEFPQFREICINEFYSIFPDMPRNLEKELEPPKGKHLF